MCVCAESFRMILWAKTLCQVRAHRVSSVFPFIYHQCDQSGSVLTVERPLHSSYSSELLSQHNIMGISDQCCPTLSTGKSSQTYRESSVQSVKA